ncbi:hypothetical protein HU200_040016 [Digitaria exilis]|uniref:NAD-dependent epimerase/dehydratase domain-containing protein n=1 Tax=Digitaria exilis TaxID=1010633 RepID=A0A835EKG0_9POAL|nr:hypothetical protein HU200_040016 [Digitaria exilis]
MVCGTVRNPDEEKNAHLRALDGAAERLTLVRADLLDKESLAAAFRGCEGVFHTASPVTDDPEKMIEPAVNGTKNVINAAADVATLRRVVFTSSIGTVYMGSHHAPGAVVDEKCWSDLEYCKNTKNWYCYAKTVAEQAAWELAKQRQLDLVVVNPSLVLGPMLEPSVNASTWHILEYLDGSVQTYTDAVQSYVHVKDVAEAHARVYEEPTACGRYLCAGRTLHRGEVCRILAKLFPEYPVPTECKGGTGERKGAGSAAGGWPSLASGSHRRASVCTIRSPASRGRAFFHGVPLLLLSPLLSRETVHLHTTRIYRFPYMAGRKCIYPNLAT